MRPPAGGPRSVAIAAPEADCYNEDGVQVAAGKWGSEMAVIAPPRRMSLEEFRSLPEGPPYVEREPNGEVTEVASEKRRHNQIVGLVYGLIYTFARTQKLGTVVMTVDVFFPSGRVTIPDLCFVGRDQPELLGEDGKVHGVPRMVAEVISEDGRTRDRVEKFDAYREEGVEWYWLLDAETLDIEEYHLENGRYVSISRRAAGQGFTPALFPGCVIDLALLVAEE